MLALGLSLLMLLDLLTIYKVAKNGYYFSSFGALKIFMVNINDQDKQNSY